MALTTASSSRRTTQSEVQDKTPKRRSPEGAFNLYNKIVNGRGAPATQFGCRAGFRQKIYAIGNLLSADLFRMYLLGEALDDMTPALREQITITPTDYLRKCLALRLAEYRQVDEQYEIENPLQAATTQGEAELKHHADFCKEISADALAVWQEITGVAAAHRSR